MSTELDPEVWPRLIARIRNGDSLPAEARAWLIELLEIVRRGEDPCAFAGTKRPPHAPEKPRAIVGMHYWLLRKKYGKGGSAAALKEVTLAWGFSDSRVKEIARNCKSAFCPGIERMDPDKLEEVLAGILPEGL